MARRGFPEASQKIQDCWLSGDKEGAMLAVPDEYIDQSSLIGPVDRIRERFTSLVPNGATGLIIRTTDMSTIELMAEITNLEYGLE